MEPTTPRTPPAGPPAVGGGLVEYLRTNRQNAGVGLLALAAVFIALAGFFALKAFRDQPAEKPPEEKQADPLGKSDAKPPTQTEAQAARLAQYNLAWLGFLAAAMVAGAGGAVFLARLPAATAEDQRAEVRVVLLAVGGLLGLLLIVVGALYFYQWSESLTNWLNKGEAREAKWVLIPLLMVVAGAGLVFVSIQPARAEERNSPLTRRLVYGSNFALTVLLLLVTLVVANVAFALKVPNKLDTTATGFYSITDATKNLFARLAEPVKVYAVVPDTVDRQGNDIRQLLLACEDAAGGKFTVKFLSEVADKTELASLRQKYTRFNEVLNQRFLNEDELPGAVLLTVGEDEVRHRVIPNRDFSEPGGKAFKGEGQLYKEVAFLADNETRPVVYFTQGHRELALTPAPGAGRDRDRSIGRLKTYLENRYLSPRPLDLGGANPAVPDDAAVVVVADPTEELSAPAVAALRKYATNPAKKGKLIVLAGAHTGGDRKMIKTGLEPLLAELNVRLGTKFVYNFPSQNNPYVNVVLAAFTEAAEQNETFQSVVKVSPVMQMIDPREVESLTTNPALQATEFMLSLGQTWPEDEPPGDLRAVVQEMSQTVKAQEARRLSRAPRSLAVIVSEGAASRAVVIGDSFFMSDAAGSGQSQAAPLSFRLIGASVDWLREKPSLEGAEIESKTYSEYRFPNPTAVDETRLKMLPLVLAFLLVAGVGAGVWVVRRK